MKTTLINLLILLLSILAIQLLTSCTTTCGLQQSERAYHLDSPYFDYTVFDDYGELIVTTSLPICDDGQHFLHVPDCGQYEPTEITRDNKERTFTFCFDDQDFYCAMSSLNQATLSVCQPSAGH